MVNSKNIMKLLRNLLTTPGIDMFSLYSIFFTPFHFFDHCSGSTLLRMSRSIKNCRFIFANETITIQFNYKNVVVVVTGALCRVKIECWVKFIVSY